MTLLRFSPSTASVLLAFYTFKWEAVVRALFFPVFFVVAKKVDDLKRKTYDPGAPYSSSAFVAAAGAP